MRLGFKRFSIGKREFVVTVLRHLNFENYYEDGKVSDRKYLQSLKLNLIPVIRYEYSCSSQNLVFEWLLWTIYIEDETYVNMGCPSKKR